MVHDPLEIGAGHVVHADRSLHAAGSLRRVAVRPILQTSISAFSFTMMVSKVRTYAMRRMSWNVQMIRERRLMNNDQRCRGCF